MKKIIFIISFLLAILYVNPIYATETNETIQEQEKALGISDFLQEAEKYTKDTFTDTNLSDIYSSAISGNMNMSVIVSTILKLVGDETLNTIRTLRICFNYCCYSQHNKKFNRWNGKSEKLVK